MTRKQPWLLGALILLYIGVLASTAPAIGFTRDEGYYFKAAELYAGWWGEIFSRRFWEAFSDPVILRYFSYNHEHPPLVKLTQGITWAIFHRGLGLASPAQGFRITGFLFAGLSLWATYQLGKTLISARVGLLAAAFLAVMPRYFYDAHLANFDVPVTAMWTLSVTAFVWAYRAPEPLRMRRAWVSAAVFGLGLATKLNVLFLPFLFVAWWIYAPWEPIRFGLRQNALGGRDLRWPRVPALLWLSAILGPILFVAVWPYLWHDTLNRIGGYIAFHLHHEHYPALYFGDLLVKPPFPVHFPFVMSFYTIPAPVLLLGTAGLLAALLRSFWRRQFSAFVLLTACLLPVCLIAMPKTPIFGGVKHWYNALPSFAVLAASAFFWALDQLPAMKPKLKTGLTAGLIALSLGPGALGIWASHPNGIGFYNALAGGFRGGAELGMQRGFWGGLAGPLIRGPLSEPQSGGIYLNRTNYDDYRMYVREGSLAIQTRYANTPSQADWALDYAQPEHAEATARIWQSLGHRPVDGVYQDNVTLVELYQRGVSSKPPQDPPHSMSQE